MDTGVRFGPERLSLLPVLVLLMGALPLAASAAALQPLLLVPLACAVWVLRARVVVRPQELEVCNGLGVTRLPWEQVEGYDVARLGPVRGPVRVLTRGRRVPLTAVPPQRLGDLVRATRQTVGPGRPDEDAP
ncbi:MAG: PH domain-containing protein [Actinomycetota bacterium]|nr:PH domain-containing protein [Actinomycetota bacterium]